MTRKNNEKVGSNVEGNKNAEKETIHESKNLTQQKKGSISQSDEHNDLFDLFECADSNEKFLSSLEGSSELDEPFQKSYE